MVATRTPNTPSRGQITATVFAVGNLAGAIDLAVNGPLAEPNVEALHVPVPKDGWGAIQTQQQLLDKLLAITEHFAAELRRQGAKR